MSIRRPMTETELRFFKESVIREYKAKQEAKQRNRRLNSFLSRLRSIIPLNIAIGVTASILLINFKGWDLFIQLLLTGIIWITLISTIVGAVVGKK